MRSVLSDFGIADVSTPARSELAQRTPPGAAPVQRTQQFDLQSTFDSTLLQNSILEQDGAAGGIVLSTLTEEKTEGYAVGLHPASETPIAVQFRAGAGGQGSSALILTPGMVVRPYGEKPFSAFRWGLPFGWLGGGVATIWIFPTRYGTVDWKGGRELVFHRTRIAVQDDNATPSGSTNNWPGAFPWELAQRKVGSNTFNQYGFPQLVPTPTRTVLVLRANIAVPRDVRLYWTGTDHFGSTGIYRDVTFPANTGALVSAFPVVELSGVEGKLSANNGAFMVLDTNAGDPLSGTFVDVVRYGVL